MSRLKAARVLWLRAHYLAALDIATGEVIGQSSSNETWQKNTYCHVRICLITTRDEVYRSCCHLHRRTLSGRCLG